MKDAWNFSSVFLLETIVKVTEWVYYFSITIVERTIKTAFVTALVLVVGVICIFSFHNSFTDRLNPFISQETSYAQVDKGTQRYYNVKAYNPKTKKNLLLKKVGGYDPSGQYISIQHKGQYVKSIKYITRKQFMQAKE